MDAWIVVVMSLATAAILLLLLSCSPSPRKATAQELTYTHILTSRVCPFPSLSDVASVDFSIIVPCYNEQDRLAPMLREAVDHLSTISHSWEIICVDDGSKDHTFNLAMDLGRAFYNENKCLADDFRVMRLEVNRGKGGAVTQGMIVARGKKLLFVDADGATLFSDLTKLDAALAKDGVAIGSRAHMVHSDAVVKRTFLRNILMRGFHFLVALFGIHSIKDTQCGFKLFSRSAALKIFPGMHIERWIFDIEILVRCESKGVNVVEVPVTWKEVDGTKMEFLKDAIEMFIQLVMIRANYLFRFWK